MAEIKYWYEDLTPGLEFSHPERTITAEEIIEFASEFDPQPFHLSEEAGRNSILGGLSASGWHTCAITMRQFYDTILQHAAAEGAPGIDLTEWRRPVLAGDTLGGKTRVLEARPMKSRPGLGILKFRHEITNQRGETVMVMEHPGFVRFRPGALA